MCVAQRGWGEVHVCQNSIKNVTCAARQRERSELVEERGSAAGHQQTPLCLVWDLFPDGVRLSLLSNSQPVRV